MRNVIITVAIFLLSITLLSFWLIGGAIIKVIWEHKIVTLLVVIIAYLIVTSIIPPEDS